jgi:FtsP/CotA-like multicopper oxidase with cupredoxin domain
MTFLTHFDNGKVSSLPDGHILREFELTAIDKEIVVASGVGFPAWTYNGQVPGPTIRCTEGDIVKVHFRNSSGHAHTIHFHGFHQANMDGVFEQVQPGESYTYEFTAEPPGMHLYHCHTMPVSKHIAKGLHGVFIVDPREPRPPATEMVMVLNGFDVNFDEENEFYTVNGIANYYMDNPIRIGAGKLIRIYVANLTEFDAINSFHTHATFFHYYPTGTSPGPSTYTDTIILGQGERGIMELTYRWPGRYLFHAHKNEFAERGWIGMFEVT